MVSCKNGRTSPLKTLGLLSLFQDIRGLLWSVYFKTYDLEQYLLRPLYINIIFANGMLISNTKKNVTSGIILEKATNVTYIDLYHIITI